MRMLDSVSEWFANNARLLRSPERYRDVWIVRTVVFISCGTAVVLFIQVFRDKIQFDIGFVLGVFSMFISWMFYWLSDRNSRLQIDELRRLVDELRMETSRGLTSIQESLTRPFFTPGVPEPSSGTRLGTENAKALASVMEPGAKQMLIALRQIGAPVSASMTVQYAFELDRFTSSGTTIMSQIAPDLVKAGLLVLKNSGDYVELSDRGKELVDWLQENGHKAGYFISSSLGSWGTPSSMFRRVWGDMTENMRDG